MSFINFYDKNKLILNIYIVLKYLDMVNKYPKRIFLKMRITFFAKVKNNCNIYCPKVFVALKASIFTKALMEFQFKLGPIGAL